MNNCVRFVYTHNRDSSCRVCGRSTGCVMYTDFCKCMLLWMATVVNSAYHRYNYSTFWICIFSLFTGCII